MQEAPLIVSLGWIDIYIQAGKAREALGLMAPLLAATAAHAISGITDAHICAVLNNRVAFGMDTPDEVQSVSNFYVSIETAILRAVTKAFLADYCASHQIDVEEESFVFISPYEERLYEFIREHPVTREAISHIIKLYGAQPGTISALQDEILSDSRYNKKPLIKG